VSQPAVDGGRGHALELIGDGSGNRQLTEGPLAIHLTEQEGFQSLSAGWSKICQTQARAAITALSQSALRFFRSFFPGKTPGRILRMAYLRF